MLFLNVSLGMGALVTYGNQAVKLATVEKLGGGEGYVARIPGFPGLIGTGRTKKETRVDLKSALEGWVELRLKRGETTVT